MDTYNKLKKELKVEWSKEFLMPGLKKLSSRIFSNEELCKFFVLAHHDKYGEIKRLAIT